LTDEAFWSMMPRLYDNYQKSKILNIIEYII